MVEVVAPEWRWIFLKISILEGSHTTHIIGSIVSLNILYATNFFSEFDS